MPAKNLQNTSVALTRYSDINELNANPRRRVGGMPNVNKDRVKTRKSDNSDAKTFLTVDRAF